MSVDTGMWWWCSGGPPMGPRVEEKDVGSMNPCAPLDGELTLSEQPSLTDSSFDWKKSVEQKKVLEWTWGKRILV